MLFKFPDGLLYDLSRKRKSDPLTPTVFEVIAQLATHQIEQEVLFNKEVAGYRTRALENQKRLRRYNCGSNVVPLDGCGVDDGDRCDEAQVRGDRARRALLQQVRHMALRL